MLAGLINDGVERGSDGIPGLSKIPIIGGLRHAAFDYQPQRDNHRSPHASCATRKQSAT